MVTIRAERAGDYGEIHRVVREAFASAEHTDGDEHNLVNRLRGGTSYLPELSLVAEEEGRIVGYLMFTRLLIAGTAQLALAPLAVLPEYQGRGIGSGLIREGHRIAARRGYRYSVVLGSAGYYPKFGYRPADEFGIRPPFEVERTLFMALPLNGADPAVRGTVRYAEEFGL